MTTKMDKRTGLWRIYKAGKYMGKQFFTARQALEFIAKEVGAND